MAAGDALMMDSIDWSRPWFRSAGIAHNRLEQLSDWRKAVNQQSERQQLKNVTGQPIRFVEQHQLAPEMSYEVFIHQTGGVPTRDNLHDFFNALVWLVFPRIKSQLNALQAGEILRNGVAQSRGVMRDAATLFDENAALLVVRNSDQGLKLVNALHARAWHQLFVEHRAEFMQCCDVWLFGHALMEKLIKPYKAITAHAWVVQVNDEYFLDTDEQRCQWLDRTIAVELQRCRTEQFHPRRFMPLPVLGVPGWWPQQDVHFYADNKVFRPGPSPTPAQR